MPPVVAEELMPDFERSYQRYLAFWQREIIDRPLVCITLPKEAGRGTGGNRAAARTPVTSLQDVDEPPRSATGKVYASQEERWLDFDTRIDEAEKALGATLFLGDAVPVVWPNMGPEIFSAWCGAGYRYGETTTWTVPSIVDWEPDAPKARLDTNHPLFKATLDFTDRLIERGRGRYIVGLTDFHPGGDHLAALRDPEQLAVDLYDQPERVKELLGVAARDYFRAYDIFYDRLHNAGMPSTSWLNLLSEGKYYIPSNDFSGMISTPMFEEFFLDGIVEECRFLDNSIYHLDGPGALHHLDVLLGIKELDAIQFIPGAGNEGLERWIPIYQRIQARGKGMQILDVTTEDYPLLFEHLLPEGVFVSDIAGVRSVEEADYILKRFERWC